MKTKKLLSVLLSLLMLTGVFAVNASAESAINKNDVFVAGTLVSGTAESYWLTVDGALTADGASAADYNVKYTPASEDAPAKITLRNANLSKINVIQEESFVGIYADCALDVEISGSNTFTILPDGIYYAYGIGASGDLNIYGSGSLKMDLGTAATAAAGGITSGNKLNVSGDVDITVNANGFYTICGAYSLYASTFSDSASLEINAACYKNEDYGPDSFVGYRITYDGIILSDNAKVNVKVNNPDAMDIGTTAFDIKGSVTLSDNSHLTAIAADGTGSYGIGMNNGSIAVSGTSTITAKAGNASDSKSIGILCYNGSATGLTVTASDNSKITATAGNAAAETVGIYAYAQLTAADNAYISGTSGDSSTSNGSAGAIFWSGITLSGKSKLIAKAGNSSDENYGINTGGDITVSDASVIEGYAGTCSKSIGINCENIVVSGNAKLTGESKGSTEEESAGIFAEKDFKAYGNAEINAKGGNGGGSAGIYADEITVYGSAKINAAAGTAVQTSTGLCSEGNLLITENASVTAESGKAPKSVGIFAHRNSVISGDAQVTTKAASGTGSFGFFGSDNTAYSLTVTDNAVITAEAAQGTEHSIGLFVPTKITVSKNAKVTAIGGEAEKYGFGLASSEMKINNAATVEATGSISALAADMYEILGYADVYIAVSTDKNPDNAVEFDNTNPLVSYDLESKETIKESPYKYVLIAPEEPEPELSFFEQLIADISAFFNSIIEFFTSLFSFMG